MPVHWGFDGRPDRWMPKTLPRLYAIFPVALAVQALLGFILYALANSGPPSRRRAVNLTMIAGLDVAVAAMLAVVALAPVRGALGLPGGPWTTLLTLAPLVPLIWISVRLQRAELEEPEPTRDDCWHGGLIYSDPTDSRLMVPNRLGSGYGFNLGHPVARVAFPLLIAANLAAAFAPLLFM